MSREFRTHNHYVPAIYLKYFANESGRIFSYRTLVNTPQVPLWKQSSPAGVGYLAHLYTRIFGGKESDDFERWLDAEFESPAAKPLSKAVTDLPLRSSEWRTLGRLVGAQAVRTPASFLRLRSRWQKDLPGLLENVLKEILQDMRDRRARGGPSPAVIRDPAELLPVKLVVEPDSDPALARVSATTITGRDMWLFAMRKLLTETVPKLETTAGLFSSRAAD